VEASSNVPVEPQAVAAAVAEARGVLAADGGDIELVAVEGRTVRERLRGACAGRPNAPLDLRSVVTRIVRNRAPGVCEVVSDF
jgi:toxin CptA